MKRNWEKPEVEMISVVNTMGSSFGGEPDGNSHKSKPPVSSGQTQLKFEPGDF